MFYLNVDDFFRSQDSDEEGDKLPSHIHPESEEERKFVTCQGKS